MYYLMKNKCGNNDLNLIINNIILNVNNLQNLGLYRGKMGIILFFYHYAQYSKNIIYEDFANELIDELCDELTTQLPITFDDGLCGIGWGLEYLINNNFIAGDSNEILREFDLKIMEINVKRISDLSFDTGLAGIVYYVYSRLIAAKSDAKKVRPFDLLYLTELYNSVLELKDQIKDKFSIQIFDKYEKCLKNDLVKNEILSLPDFLYNDNLVSLNDLKSVPLGIKNGITGLGLKLIKQ